MSSSVSHQPCHLCRTAWRCPALSWPECTTAERTRYSIEQRSKVSVVVQQGMWISSERQIFVVSFCTMPDASWENLSRYKTIKGAGCKKRVSMLWYWHHSSSNVCKWISFLSCPTLGARCFLYHKPVLCLPLQGVFPTSSQDGEECTTE